jgi:hypothetical protein
MLVHALLCVAAAAQDSSAVTSVAFVGDLNSARTTSFVEFLESRFAQVRVLEREGLDPSAAAGADVVLLDWDQSSGVMRWFEDRTLVLEHPLGPRAEWSTPTVLLGSAGLNTAAAWDVRGGSG